jgi:hypothetical protein
MTHTRKKTTPTLRLYSIAWRDNQGNRWSSLASPFDIQKILAHGGKIIGKPREID